MAMWEVTQPAAELQKSAVWFQAFV
jgi:hypothetical protein